MLPPVAPHLEPLRRPRRLPQSGFCPPASFAPPHRQSKRLFDLLTALLAGLQQPHCCFCLPSHWFCSDRCRPHLQDSSALVVVPCPVQAIHGCHLPGGLM